MRRGSRIFGFVSKDGQNWTGKLRPIDTVWPSEVKIGIDAVSSSSEPFAVRFEDLSGVKGRPGQDRRADPGSQPRARAEGRVGCR